MGPLLIHLPETDSTNAVCWRRFDAGDAPPFWVRADQQTAGRGRRGRSWITDEGALALSGAYRIVAKPGDAAQLSFVAALAAAEAALAHAPDADVRLKWPNDVRIGEAKLAGVLLEAAPDPEAPEDALRIVIGVGMNVARAPDDLDRPVTSLGAVMDRAPPDPARVAVDLIAAFDEGLATWTAHGFTPIRAAWLTRGHRVGEPLAAGDVTGTFLDLAPDGALILSTPDGPVTVRAGDVETLSFRESA